MNWMRRLFGKGVRLPAEQMQRLANWRAASGAQQALARCVVVDVETSGLDPTRDRLIAIGAIAVEGAEIRLGDSFEIVLRQEQPSTGKNILVHGIGGTAQAEGVEVAEGLIRFLEYVGHSPLVAFHVAFDQEVIGRAIRRHLGFRFEHAWLDLAYVAPALYPRLAGRCRSLDNWSAHFGIGNYKRHSALADAYATAQLLLALSSASGEVERRSFAQLRDLEREQRRMRAGG